MLIFNQPNNNQVDQGHGEALLPDKKIAAKCGYSTAA
jgi:hypothetical protein